MRKKDINEEETKKLQIFSIMQKVLPVSLKLRYTEERILGISKNKLVKLGFYRLLRFQKCYPVLSSLFVVEVSKRGKEKFDFFQEVDQVLQKEKKS